MLPKNMKNQTDPRELSNSAPAPGGKPPGAELMATAGQRIRAARLAQGISGKDLAFAAGINPSFLSYIENGLKAPSMSTVLKLAQALGISVPELFRAASNDPASGERCLGLFMRIVSGSKRKERALWHELLSAYAKLVRRMNDEQRERILKSGVTLLHGLRQERLE